MRHKLGRMAALGLTVALVTALVWIANGARSGGAGGGGAELPPCGTATPASHEVISATPIATIWEVTPFASPTPIVGGPRDFLEAYFTPRLTMRLRASPSTAATTVLFLPAGVALPVDREVFPGGDKWLRVAAENGATGWVAYQVGGVTYGVFEVVQP